MADATALGDGDRGTQTGAGRDTEQVGIGEWVAEDPLVSGTRNRQSGTDDRAEHHAGQPNLPEDRLLLGSQG